MIMLGNAVFSTHPFEGATETKLSEGEKGEVVMSDVPESHPRYVSLRLRDIIVAGVENGVTSIHGLDGTWSRRSLRLPHR